MTVIALHQPKPDEIVYDDPIFFHKSQIEVGTTLKCFGRLNPNSMWSVVKIATYTKRPSGKYGLRPTENIVHLDDQIWLQRAGARERRQTSFRNLSYSAIWRLA